MNPLYTLWQTHKCRQPTQSMYSLKTEISVLISDLHSDMEISAHHRLIPHLDAEGQLSQHQGMLGADLCKTGIKLISHLSFGDCDFLSAFNFQILTCLSNGLKRTEKNIEQKRAEYSSREPHHFQAPTSKNLPAGNIS